MNKRKTVFDDLRTTDDLINVAISGFPSDEAWMAITALQSRGTKEVLNAMLPLLSNHTPTIREIAVHVIGQLGLESVTFQRETVPLLIDKLGDQSIPVIVAAAIALGYRKDAKCIPYLVRLIKHINAEVRLGVAMGLCHYDDESAIKGLITLSRDSDDEVRNWATFGLALQENVDTSALREALFQRLVDNNPEVIGEALIGLAKRKDYRVVNPIINSLEGPFDGIWAVEAAESFAIPIFYPHLVSLKRRITAGKIEPRFIKSINNAIRACTPVK
jgi:HEAT repeat protein